jgi:uncharacterized protein (DUF1015 family)
MARVVPFRALRYATRLAGEMARLATPPYDVISEAERSRFETLHPRNVIRLILPGEAGRSEDGSFYSGAAALLRAWQQEGTLEKDPVASFYPYRQSFRGPDGEQAARLGFLGALALPSGPGEKIVLPHERTLDAPRRDRTRLIEACRANLSPIFLLHPDSTGEAGRALAEVVSGPPLFTFQDDARVTHEMWKADSAFAVEKLQQALRADWTLIADGHHRYESAMAVRNEHPEEEGAGYVLAFFCSLQDRGFRVFPIHRLLRPSPGKGTTQELKQALSRRHIVTEMPQNAGPEEVLSRVRTAGAGCFGVLLPQGGPLLLQVGPAAGEVKEGDLDTELLQREVLTGTLGISAQEISGGAVAFTPDASEAFRRVREGESRAAFLLNPLKIESVVRAAQAGRRLPQKSTYFYPKVYTGLVIRPF